MRHSQAGSHEGNGACATTLRQEEVVAGFEQSLCWAAQLQAAALPPQPFLHHDPALQMQLVSGGVDEPAVLDRWNPGMAGGW